MAVVRKRQKSKVFTEEINIDQALQLNKLESHLLKIVIPFIRVAHCNRGSYIKVKGSVILISSDISHSMSRILPRKQNLLPVCLKRKMEYTGNYMEEMIDKNKVKAYFNFFRRFNPLFNELELREDEIEKYENDCDEATEIFENAINENATYEDAADIAELPDHEDSGSDSDSFDDQHDDNQNTFYNQEDEKEKDETNYFRDQSSVFCNKYEEDVNVPTVANRFANIIVDVETFYNIDIEDEIENEECNASDELSPNDKAQSMSSENGNKSRFVQDEVFNESNFFQEFDESHADNLMNAT